MGSMTLRDVPDELHVWLKQQAVAHHRSVNKEVIALLESVQGGAGALRRRTSVEDILAIGRRVASAPALDTRSESEILGYDENGIPG